jgi:hypothetical protein
MTRPLDAAASPSRLVGAALHALWWSVPVGMMAASRAVQGGEQTWPGVLIFWVLWTALGTIICSGLVLLARRLNVLAWSPVRQLLAGGAGAVLGTLAFASVTAPLVLLTSTDPEAPNTVMGIGIVVALTFLAWVPAALFVGQLQRLGQIERGALRARADATETELRAVRQQVNSHLVFNALNSILVAIEEGAPQAAAMVLDLSSLLRQSLEALPHMGTLGDELARLELYGRIERSRFEDDLQITLDVAPGLRGLPCLPMLLQPLVENAIKHGFAGSEPPLHVDLRAEQGAGIVTVRVTNDGELERRAAGSPPRTGRDTGGGGLGLGLPATRKRLEQEYGSAALLELAQSTEGGGRRVTAKVSWPVPVPGLDPVSGRP